MATVDFLSLLSRYGFDPEGEFEKECARLIKDFSELIAPYNPDFWDEKIQDESEIVYGFSATCDYYKIPVPQDLFDRLHSYFEAFIDDLIDELDDLIVVPDNTPVA